jgi:murein L,D-transpeptidase YafK
MKPRWLFALCTTVGVLSVSDAHSYWPIPGLDWPVNYEVRRPFFRKPIPRDVLSLVCEHPHLVILKSQRKLLLINGRRLIKAYDIDLGRDPQGDKRRLGDCRTPEGEFYVCRLVNPSRYHRAFLLSYPNIEDAAKGYLSELISLADYVRIVEANIRKEVPPQYTKLGGLLEIHGSRQGVDWTLGCAALHDNDMDELWHIVRTRTPVTILP